MAKKILKVDELIAKVPALLPGLSPSKKIPIRATLHWTGGSFRPTGEDSTHYHFLIDFVDGEAHVRQGVDLRLNCPKAVAGYAAHTRGANSNNIGLALCGMWQSSEAECNEGRFGKYPIQAEQVEAAALLAAIIAKRYGIPVEANRVLGHSEWRTLLGVPQAGKWDVTCLPHMLITPDQIKDGRAEAMDFFRDKVRTYLRQI